MEDDGAHHGDVAADRTLLALTGPDRAGFLQGLVTNDLGRLAKGLVYAALLTPQGKYLADFFVVPQCMIPAGFVPAGGAMLLDVKTTIADALLRRLTMYRLRAAVMIAPVALAVTRGTGAPPPGASADPRHPSLGWRAYAPTDSAGRTAGSPVDWDELRVAACIPETGVELIPDETYVLEAGFERLNGVDFRKGCYVGQEVTARMKHKTDLRKGLTTVSVIGSASPGTEITADGKSAGTLYTQAGGRGIAYLRFDRAAGPMRAAGADVHWTPDWRAAAPETGNTIPT